MSLMFAAFYVFGVQGRPKAFYMLSNKDMQNAWLKGEREIESRWFKTVSKYDYQVNTI